MTRIKEIWKLKLMHDHFMSGRCNYGKMVLSPQSGLLLSRRQCRFPKMGVGEWGLYSFDEANFDTSDILEMDYIVDDKEFLYNTQWNWEANGSCPRIEIGIDTDVKIDMTALPGKMVSCKTNVLFQLAVSLQKVNNERVTVAELDFTTKSLYWEYWFIPRDGNFNRNLELEIISDEECCFIPYQNLDNPLGARLIMFRTSVPLKLKEGGQVRINLFEKIGSRIRKPLMRNLQVPTPGEIPYKIEDSIIALRYL